MNFSIITLYNGRRAKIYTILFANKELSEYEQFIFENMSTLPEAVKKLEVQLKRMANYSGLIDEFFKRESKKPYNVFRIEETENNLRLFCIKFSGVAIVLGSGGIKIPGKIKLVDNPHLDEICEQLKIIEDRIVERIRTREITLTDDGLQGNLDF